MKVRIPYRISLMVLAAVALLSVFSCSDRSRYADSVMAAADSLMMSDPHAALDTLITIDSAVAAGMTTKQNAFYALLGTEARYKCYLPVAEDTAIFDAVGYYRRHGPEDKMVRVLMIQGAVCLEREDIQKAMNSYKEAEAIAEQLGDLELLGLINTRIGEIYQRDVVYKSEAIGRYRRALHCFVIADLPVREMQTHLSLAALLLVDSARLAIMHIDKGMFLAQRYNDRVGILSALALYNGVNGMENHDAAVVSKTIDILQKHGYEPENEVEKPLYTNILTQCAESYASMHKIDSAKLILSKINTYNPVDSIGIYMAKKAIVEVEGNWEDALRYEYALNRISDSVAIAGYKKQLTALEKINENRLLRDELQRKTINSLIVVAILLTAIILLLVFSFFLKGLLVAQKRKNNQIQSINDELAGHVKKLSAMQMQEEENREQLTQMLKSQLYANSTLRNFYCRANEVMDCILDDYYRYEADYELFAGKTVENVKSYVAEECTQQRAMAVMDAAYPGFLSQLIMENPKLTDEDIKIIALTSCGFSTGALCTILNITENYLNVKKVRISKKLGVEGGLTRYLKSRISDYRMGQNLQRNDL